VTGEESKNRGGKGGGGGGVESHRKNSAITNLTGFQITRGEKGGEGTWEVQGKGMGERKGRRGFSLLNLFLLRI